MDVAAAAERAANGHVAASRRSAQPVVIKHAALAGLQLSPTVPPRADGANLWPAADDARAERVGELGASASHSGLTPPDSSRSSLRNILASMRGGFTGIVAAAPPPASSVEGGAASSPSAPAHDLRLPLIERKEAGLRALEGLRESITGARGGRPLPTRSFSHSRFPKRDAATHLPFGPNPYAAASAAAASAQAGSNVTPPRGTRALEPLLPEHAPGESPLARGALAAAGSRTSSSASLDGILGGAGGGPVGWTDDLEFVYDLLRSEELHHMLAVADASWDSSEGMRTKLASKDLRDYFRAIFSPDAMPAEADDQLLAHERQTNECAGGGVGAGGGAGDEGGFSSAHIAVANGRAPIRGDVAQRLRAPSRFSLGGASRPVGSRRSSSSAAIVRRAARRSLADEDTSMVPVLLASLASADDARILRWSGEIAAGDEDISILDLSRVVADPLTFVAMVLFSRHKLNDTFGIGFARMQSFCKALNAGYRDSNAFHNQVHAADVCYAMHVFILHSGVVEQRGLEPFHILAVLFGALVHDFRHPGVTNTFLITTADPLALTYNDRSVLENYHAAEAFKLMQHAQYNLLRALDGKQQRELRTLVVKLILSTDMAEHFGQVTELVSTAPKPVRRAALRARAGDGSAALRMLRLTRAPVSLGVRRRSRRPHASSVASRARAVVGGFVGGRSQRRLGRRCGRSGWRAHRARPGACNPDAHGGHFTPVPTVGRARQFFDSNTRRVLRAGRPRAEA